MLRRHDYSVNIAGGFAAAQLTSDYVDANGIRLPSKRRAYTRGPDRRPILEMLMVSIDISDVSFTFRSGEKAYRSNADYEATDAIHLVRRSILPLPLSKVKPVLPPFEFMALLRQGLIHSAPEGPSSVRESRLHGSAREA